MEFSFERTIEFNLKRDKNTSVGSMLMGLVYPGIFNEDGYAELEVTVEVEDFIPRRDAPNIKNTADSQFYDDGDNFEASVKLYAEIAGLKMPLPDCLMAEDSTILDDVEAEGLRLIAENQLDRDIERYERKIEAR